MDIEQAKNLLVRTHLAAIQRQDRASTYELIGKSGTAKSEGVDQGAMRMARELGQPFGLVAKMAASWQSVDFGGFMIPKNVKGYDWPLSVFSAPPWYPNRFNTKVFMPDGEVVFTPLPEDMELPQFGWLFMDEWGLLDEDLQKAGAPLFLNAGVGDFTLPIGWRVLAASNRLGDKTGVVKPLTLVVNRRGSLPIEGKYSVWQGWVNNLPEPQRPHYLTQSFAAQNAHIVFDDNAPPTNGESYCTSRSLVKMDKEIMALRTDEEISKNLVPTDVVAKQCAAGWIGGPSSAQYYTHCKYADEVPTWQQILRNPKEAKLPTRKDAQMIAAFMVASNLDNEDHVDQAMDYMTRFDTEMQVLWARQVSNHVEKGAWLTVNEKFSRWLVKMGDLLMASAG